MCSISYWVWELDDKYMHLDIPPYSNICILKEASIEYVLFSQTFQLI